MELSFFFFAFLFFSQQLPVNIVEFSYFPVTYVYNYGDEIEKSLLSILNYPEDEGWDYSLKSMDLLMIVLSGLVFEFSWGDWAQTFFLFPCHFGLLNSSNHISIYHLRTDGCVSLSVTLTYLQPCNSCEILRGITLILTFEVWMWSAAWQS